MPKQPDYRPAERPGEGEVTLQLEGFEAAWQIGEPPNLDFSQVFLGDLMEQYEKLENGVLTR